MKPGGPLLLRNSGLLVWLGYLDSNQEQLKWISAYRGQPARAGIPRISADLMASSVRAATESYGPNLVSEGVLYRFLVTVVGDQRGRANTSQDLAVVADVPPRLALMHARVVRPVEAHRSSAHPHVLAEVGVRVRCESRARTERRDTRNAHDHESSPYLAHDAPPKDVTAARRGLPDAHPSPRPQRCKPRLIKSALINTSYSQPGIAGSCPWNRRVDGRGFSPSVLEGDCG